MAINITEENYADIVLSADKPVLLDFWASWCGPCMMMSPVIDEIAGEYPQFIVGKINVDEQPQLAAAFSIISIPTLVIMKNGEVVSKMVGVQKKDLVVSKLNEA